LPARKELRGFDVGRDHAHLDELVRIVARLGAHRHDLAGGAERELGLDRIELDRAATPARLVEGLVQRVQGFEIRDALRMPGPRRAIVLADDLPYLVVGQARMRAHDRGIETRADRKSTRLNSSHVKISYAVFCLKKKKTETTNA